MANYIINENIDLEKSIESKSSKILFKINEIISDENISDFQKVDNIVELLNKHNIDTRSYHDF